MNRRNFIKKSAAAGTLVSVSSLGLLSFTAEEQRKHITILHTNDTHSHIEPFSADHAQYPNMGGISRRYSLVNSIRKENPNTLLLDAGDVFQGTPYFNFYGGELEFKLMSKLGYDAATIGNHDFDNGLEGLLAQLPHADFPFLNANYDFKNTVLEERIKPYKVFVKEGIRIGVFGLGIELQGLVSQKHFLETKYLDPVEMAEETVDKLKNEEKCQLIICLSHLGYHYKDEKISDLELAAKTKNIDLIIGGHTHTFLPKPTVVKNSEQQNVLVNQVGWAGINLGRVDFFLDREENKDGRGRSILI